MATANELLLEACASGISCLGEMDLLRIIAQGASVGGGGGGGGGGTLSTDGTFAANSDLLYPSQKAAKTYIDAAVAGVGAAYVLKAGDTMTGALILPVGSAAAPSLGVGGTTSGLLRPAANQLAISTAGTQRMVVDATGLVGIGLPAPLARLHVTPAASGTDYFRIDHNDGTPRFQVGVFPGVPSYGALWFGDVVPSAANCAFLGNGNNNQLNAAVSIDFVTASASRWSISATGMLLATTDNVVDIGATGATRPRDIFVARDVTTNNAAALIKSSVALTDGAGAGAGTISNAPSAGNPTKWIPINDNGTVRYLPAW